MAQSNYVLVVATATGCGACNNLKDAWPSMGQDIHNQIPSLTVVDMNQPSVSFDFNSPGLPANLKDYIRWFPSIAIFKKTDWNRKKLMWGAVYNGAVGRNGYYEPARTLPGLSTAPKDKVYNWIRNNTTQ